MTSPDRIPASRKRFVTLLAVLFVLAAVSVSAAAVLGPRLRSPQQVAADAAPPVPSLVTAEVTRRALTEPIVLRGRTKAGKSVPVPAPAAAIGPDSVVTKVLVKQGDRLREGRVVLERAGEPMFVLRLPFPLYRDITAGVRGPDVMEVQRALNRLGYPVAVSSRFDTATQRQIGRFYRDRGHPDAFGGADGPGEGEPGGNEPGTDDRDAAEDDDASGRAEVLRLQGGSRIPQAAVLVVGSRDALVTKVRARVGQVLTEPGAALLELDGRPPAVTALADRDQAKQLRTGQEATVVDETTGRKASVTVTTIGTEPVTGADGQDGFEVLFRFEDRPIGGANRSLRIDVAPASGAGEVLAVPVTALYSHPDGTTFVTTVPPQGAPVDVPVETGPVAGGWVEIREPADSSLAEGTPVVVGEGPGD